MDADDEHMVSGEGLNLRVPVILAAPALLAASHVITAYSFSSSHWAWLVRPLAVAILLAVVLTLAILVIVRRPSVAAIAGSVLVVLVAGGWVLWAAISGTGAWAVWSYWRHIRRRPVQLPRVETMRRIPAFALTVSLASTLVGGSITIDDVLPPAQLRAASNITEHPNIYVLLMDGYPRADTLAEFYDFDNQPFMDDLEALGFNVAYDSRSTFMWTEHTLASMLATDSISPPFPDKNDMRRQLARAPVLDELRWVGYRLDYVASPVVHVQLRGWDRSLLDVSLSELEVLLLQ